MSRLAPLLALTLLVLQITLGSAQPAQIVNVHESVETFEDTSKLATVMEDVELSRVVLHGIPESYLRYNAETEMDLSKVDASHSVILEARDAYPEQFDYVCSIDPSGSERLIQLEQCIEDGAVGVKLYVGYTRSHILSVDDFALESFFDRIEEAGLVLFYPVNTAQFGSELDNLLTAHPEMAVVCPHYCLSTKDLDGLATRLDQFPNLHLDTSFGSLDLVKDGWTRMSENHETFVDFFERYQDRILFATDNVITSYEDKSEEWIRQLYSDYVSMIREGNFQSEVEPEQTYQGLNLPFSIQQKVFWRNWEALLE